MPVTSKAQFRYAQAHKDEAWAQEFLAATPKGSYKHLPARKGKVKRKRRKHGSRH